MAEGRMIAPEKISPGILAPKKTEKSWEKLGKSEARKVKLAERCAFAVENGIKYVMEYNIDAVKRGREFAQQRVRTFGSIALNKPVASMENSLETDPDASLSSVMSSDLGFAIGPYHLGRCLDRNGLHVVRITKATTNVPGVPALDLVALTALRDWCAQQCEVLANVPHVPRRK